MDVRSQLSMVFHLDKCLGCHTCSVACKNVWTDRKGAEYMWWNNVETKPGTGFPTRWEDQQQYHGGWERQDGSLRLRATGRGRIVANIFHEPHMPTVDDYYEPWTYDYQHLFTAPAGSDQPAARPISLMTGRPIDIEAGPNWDDDLGGSAIYARNDPSLEHLSEVEREQLFALERMVFFYLPRMCNHCMNPACVAACPSGALYKRGEDGVVLGDQQRCRGWRTCVAACPYKKVFFNWASGKSEKCILCFPRVETGQAPGCFHSCVGRIRFFGAILYDASRLTEVAALDDSALVDGYRSLILDPFDPAVAEAAAASGIPDATLEAARRSPVFQFVRRWKLALPLHVEYRTFPTVFYVPPLSPALAAGSKSERARDDDPFAPVESARIPMKFLARLFAAGDEGPVRYALRKQIAVRWHRRATTVGDVQEGAAARALAEADCTTADAEAIYRLTTLSTFQERIVVPPAHREQAVDAGPDPLQRKAATGFGFIDRPRER